MIITRDHIARDLDRAHAAHKIDSPEWLTVVLLHEITETLAALSTEVTRLRRAIEVERGADPPQAREFLRRSRS